MVDMSTLLDEEELATWHAWKLANETVMSLVERDLMATTNLSGHDFGVLSRLDDNGEMRQQALAESMRWEKTRLSHHLTRMEERQLVRRKAENPKLVTIAITAAGRKMLAAARPVHARAVRTHLLEKLGARRKAVHAACVGLSDRGE